MNCCYHCFVSKSANQYQIQNMGCIAIFDYISKTLGLEFRLFKICSGHPMSEVSSILYNYTVYSIPVSSYTCQVFSTSKGSLYQLYFAWEWAILGKN